MTAICIQQIYVCIGAAASNKQNGESLTAIFLVLVSIRPVRPSFCFGLNHLRTHTVSVLVYRKIELRRCESN